MTAPRQGVGTDGAVFDVVIPAGTLGLDSGCAIGVARSLLPAPDLTLIEALLNRLGAAHAGSLTVCANGDVSPLVEMIGGSPEFASRVRLFEDTVPRGTSGCLKACEAYLQGDVILVVGGSVWLDEDPCLLIKQHRERGNALTVFCTRDAALPSIGKAEHLRPVGIYCCDRSVLDLIPERGYHDLYEQLVPALRKEGLPVGAVVVEGHTRAASDWASYMDILSQVLSGNSLLARGYRQLAPGVWCGDDVEIAPKARVVGPALLGHGCTLEDDAVVIGPVVLGDRSHVGAGSWLVRAAAPQGTRIPPGITVADRYLSSHSNRSSQRNTVPHGSAPLAPDCAPAVQAASMALPTTADSNPRLNRGIRAAFSKVSVAAAMVCGTFAWAFWDTLGGLWDVWNTDGAENVGAIVPLAAAYMVLVRRRTLPGLQPHLWGTGLFVFMSGLALSLTGEYYLYRSLENLGLVVCANGLVMILLGWRGYLRIWYPLVFLLLMIPLPGRVHDALLLPMQGISARLSVGFLEIIGVPATRFGNVLEVWGHHVAVAEACSGLRMAVAFIMVAGVVAFIIERPRWHKLIVLLSSVPIAIACNVCRIMAMACLYGAGYERIADGLVHDLAGLLMMPVAVGLIIVELRVLTHLGTMYSGMGPSGAVVREFGQRCTPETVTHS